MRASNQLDRLARVADGLAAHQRAQHLDVLAQAGERFA